MYKYEYISIMYYEVYMHVNFEVTFTRNFELNI